MNVIDRNHTEIMPITPLPANYFLKSILNYGSAED